MNEIFDEYDEEHTIINLFNKHLVIKFHQDRKKIMNYKQKATCIAHN